MTEIEQMQKNVEEFSRLQDYMSVCEKDSEPYKSMTNEKVFICLL